MPGIVGLVTRMPRERAERELLCMLNALNPNSSYVRGTRVFPDLGVYVGWVARIGAFSEGMPLFNENEDMALIFSGEEFPASGIRGHLKEKGHAMQDEKASYLVHLAEEDPSFPAGLNGRFQGVLVDRARAQATLFNDRYGMHRLYYHQSKEAFYYSVESKAILAVRPELRKLDPQGIGEFISCGCVLENRTLFHDIHVLPPGSAWSLVNGNLEERRTYFTPEQWEKQDVLDYESYYQQLRQVFARQVPQYFTGVQRVGISLTAGLDTRMIMAWHKAPSGSLPCYSFGGMFRDSQDVVVARRVSRACGQPHQVISVGMNFLTQFPQYAERTVHLTDGCVGVDHAPDLYVNERAAQIAPVRMTGNYGGEVLRQVRAFRPQPPPADLFCPQLLTQIKEAQKTYDRIQQIHPLSFVLFRQAPWHHHGLLALEETQLSLRSPYLDNDLVATVFRAPHGAFHPDVSSRLIADGDVSLSKIRTDRAPISQPHSWRSQVVRKVLDLTVKAEYAYDYGMPQWAARVDGALSSLHPEKLFLGRHKFYHFRVWYRDILSTYIQEMLLDPQTLSRSYWQRATLEKIVRSHIQGQGNYTLAIHKVLTLELIHRLFISPN